MMALRKEFSVFATACEALMGYEIAPTGLSEEEAQMIRYYLSVMPEKFALSD